MLGCVVLSDEAEPTQKVADDLCRHVHECLGGLARPANIAFLDDSPADAGAPSCATPSPWSAPVGPSRRAFVSAAQLQEAIVATH